METENSVTYVDINRLEEYRAKRLISKQRHDTDGLIIWNYTNKCQYDFAWDDITMICRGLITRTDGEIVARPFKKFFNLSQHQGDDCKLQPINWKQNFYVTEKMDGSLGILYKSSRGYEIATRGSFTSEQAKVGTGLLTKINQNFDDNLTYLFEIIYPENRIVVDYGDKSELVLLDVLDKKTGESVYDSDKFSKVLGCSSVSDLGMTKEEIESISDTNREGVVVRFEDGTRVKIKIEEYCRLHRLITGTNARRIWDILRTGGTLDELIERVPDEYFEWVRKTERLLLSDFDAIETMAKKDFENADKSWSRGKFAEYAKSKSNSRILFLMLDGREYAREIWKIVKPDHSLPFHQDADA